MHASCKAKRMENSVPAPIHSARKTWPQDCSSFQVGKPQMKICVSLQSPTKPQRLWQKGCALARQRGTCTLRPPTPPAQKLEPRHFLHQAPQQRPADGRHLRVRPLLCDTSRFGRRLGLARWQALPDGRPSGQRHHHATGLNSLLAVRDGRLDSAETAAGSQTSAQVASALAAALLPYVQQTGLDAALGLRDLRLDAAEASITLLHTAALKSPCSPPSMPCSRRADHRRRPEPGQRAGLARRDYLGLAGGHQHFAAPLSASLENENFTLSLACDSYSIAQTDAAIALVPYKTAAQRDAAIAAALAAYSTVNGLIAAALLDYSTTGQMNDAIASAVGAIDLSGYYTSAQTDAAITAVLVPVALNNAPRSLRPPALTCNTAPRRPRRPWKHRFPWHTGRCSAHPRLPRPRC